MEIVKSLKSVSIALAFLLIATGFFALIRFEIHNGVAGGKFGGADVATMPGTFWFLIWTQVLWGLYLITESIKEVWSLFHRNKKQSDQGKPSHVIAIYWMLAAFFFLVLNLLAFWSAFEILSFAYKFLKDLEMPKKAIVGGLFLLCFIILCSIYYNFLLRNLIDTFYSKAKVSFQVLRRSKNEHTL